MGANPQSLGVASAAVSTWTFIFLMAVLKIPVIAALWIVWWAVHQVPDQEPGPRGGDGGPRRHPHTRGPLPSTPRRGPHAEPAPASPPRTRAVVARARHHA